MNDFRADLGALEGLVNGLRAGAAALDGPAASATDTPDAGDSTAKVAGALAGITQAAAGVAQGVSQAADDVKISRGTYENTDHRAETGLGHP